DRVPVTSTISVDANKKVTLLKRPSSGTNEIPQKKAKIIPTATKPTASTTIGQNINKQKPIT
ncbi:unnamed protein product, partial [Rotaria magnacalcarata]